jgi:hypothetical protein
MAAPKVMPESEVPNDGGLLLVADKTQTHLADDVRRQVRVRIERELPRLIRERVLGRLK